MPGENFNLESGGNAGAGQESTWDNFQDGSQGDSVVEQQVQQQSAGGELSTGDVKTVDPQQPAAALPAAEAGADVSQVQPTVDPMTGMIVEPVVSTVKPEEHESLKSNYEALQAELETVKQRADFYQTQFNERYLSEAERTAQGGQQGQPGAQQPVAGAAQPPAGPDQLPEGVLPPEEWTTQSDMVPYFEHSQNKQIQQVYQKSIKPMFDRINQVVGAMEDMVVNSQFKDFKEVTGKVMADLFTLDPSGKVVGIKDPATLSWIQQSPMPRLALYKYAQSKKAPELIKQAKQDATTDLLNQINQKPKITAPVGGGGSGRASAALDWDTPKDQADALLGQKGLI